MMNSSHMQRSCVSNAVWSVGGSGFRVQEVLSFATREGRSRPDMVRQLEDEQQAEDEKFVHQMEQALRISE
jgi:hypothetical protein